MSPLLPPVPSSSKHRMYEALRAFFVEGKAAKQIPRTFGMPWARFRSFATAFGATTIPSSLLLPATAPPPKLKKTAARELIIRLRKQNYSVYEISEALKEQKRPLSPTAVREVLKDEGFAPAAPPR